MMGSDMEPRKNSNDIVFPNPLQRVGKTFEGEYGTLKALVLTVPMMLAGLGLGAYNIDSVEKLTMDNTGTEQAVNIATEHRETLSELNDQAHQLNQMQITTELSATASNESAEYQGMQSNFAENTLQAFFNLYTKGATIDNGAALSEADFEIFHNKLVEIADGNIDSTIYDTDNFHPAALDECLAETTNIATGDSQIKQFSTVNEITSCMADKKSEEAGNELIFLLMSTFAIPFAAGVTLKTTSLLSDMPRNITIRRRKDHNH